MIRNFYLSVAAHTLVWADPCLRYTNTLLGRKASKQATNCRCKLAVSLWYRLSRVSRSCHWSYFTWVVESRVDNIRGLRKVHLPFKSGIMEADDRQVTTVLQSNRHSTIGTRKTQYQEALPSSANDEVRCDCTFADDGNTS